MTATVRAWERVAAAWLALEWRALSRFDWIKLVAYVVAGVLSISPMLNHETLSNLGANHNGELLSARIITYSTLAANVLKKLAPKSAAILDDPA